MLRAVLPLVAVVALLCAKPARGEEALADPAALASRVTIYRDEGVVLRTHKLGEADRIVTVLTRRTGKIRAVAKGVSAMAMMGTASATARRGITTRTTARGTATSVRHTTRRSAACGSTTARSTATARGATATCSATTGRAAACGSAATCSAAGALGLCTSGTATTARAAEDAFIGRAAG